jgi:hypothetical protein
LESSKLTWLDVGGSETTLNAACAYGPGKPVLLTFDGDHLSVDPVDRVGAHLHLAVADLNAAKDTVAILCGLQTAYPRPTTAIHEARRLTADHWALG